MEIFKDQFNRYKTNAEKYQLREKLFGSDEVIPMWVADMDIPSPQFVLDDLKERLAHPILGYEEFPKSAKKAQKKWLIKNHNLKVDIKDILFSTSVVTSINIAINAFTNEGDEIIVQAPVYPLFFSSIKNNNRKVLINNLVKDKDDTYRFDINDLKSKISKKTKMILLCSPHNPVGRVWSKKELQEICKVCIENNILIFSDEIHSDLIFTPNKHIPTASISKKIKANTITTFGVGKTFNLAGMATSTVIISNKKLREKFENISKKFHLEFGNILGYIAFESAYKNGHLYRDDLLLQFEKNIDKLKKLLNKHNNIIKFKKPEGTYLLWLDCSGLNLSNKEIKEFFIKEAKLGLSTGVAFGKNGNKYMRMNIAIPDTTMDEALKRLDRALKGIKR